MKKLLLIIAAFFSMMLTAQQTEGFRQIKIKYAELHKDIEKQCTAKVDESGRNETKLKEAQKWCSDSFAALELSRVSESLAELERVNSYKRVSSPVSPPSPEVSEEPLQNVEVIPEYPTGINGMRNEIASLVNTDVLNSEGTLRTEITFVVERDGSISNVRSRGADENFNKQAEIALYMTEHRWKPALHDGLPVRYLFRLPLIVNFE